jgi:AcrR family transcriptional regulator
MSPRVTPENRIPDIVNAAIRVFGQKGFRLTQMEEIAAEAGISKATLYYYFKSKIHLFYYVLESGIPKNGATLPPPESVSVRSERDLFKLLKKRLKEGSRFKSIEEFLGKKTSDIDLAHEIAEITEEHWNICERNRIQIIILEKSAFEFPELAEIYDEYARQQILSQLEQYLEARTNLGLIRPLNSIPATARFIMESVAWFGFKQSRVKPAKIYSKSEALPDLVSILTRGLKE